MRVRSLEFIGVGPFRDRQFIDFQQLGLAGIFLIDGPTGAGKTTIIDAIVFALYGDVSGKEADSSRMRSAFSTPSEPTEVTLEFSVGERRIWIQRTPKYQRAKKHGEGTTDAAASQLLREFAPDGSVRAELTSASDIGAHINELLGMNAQQFRQLVVLPQGEFAELLRMKPSERFTALGPLLGDAFYKRLQDDLEKAGAEAKAQRASAEVAMRNSIQQIMGALGDLVDEPAIADAVALVSSEQASTTSIVESLQEIEQWLKSKNTELTKALLNAKRRANDAQVEASRALEYKQALAAVLKARDARAEALANLNVNDENFSREDAQQQVEENLQLLTKLEPIVQREQNRQDSENQVQGLVLAIEEQRLVLEELTQLASVSPAQRARLEQTITAFEILHATNTQRESDLSLLRETQKNLAQLEELEHELNAATRSSKEALERVSQTENHLAEERKGLDSLLLSQRHQRAAFLAVDLDEDAPCPVCGSRNHPLLASFPDEAVSDAIIDEKRATLEELQVALLEYKGIAEQLTTEEQLLGVQVAHLRGAVAGHTSVSISEAIEVADSALQETQKAGLELPLLREELADLKAQEASNDDSMKLGRESLTKLVTQLEALEKTLLEQEQVDREVVGEGHSAFELDRHTRGQIELLNSFRTLDEKLALAHAGLPTLELDRDVEEWLEGVALASEQANLALAEIEQQAGLIVHAAQLFKNPKTALLAAMNEHGELFERTAPAIALAEAVTAGKTSFNARRMTLQSYAVQRRFESVLDAASLHLSRMSSGKYTLEIDDTAKGNAQAGLGIKVNDAWSGQSRDPRSLSGGETFYAALALALGLADVVRDEAGGTQLETLFVDEGFGSLDQESLQLVLEQLDALRSGGRIVGVVSHVTEMKEWVNQRIEVQVTPDRTSQVRTLL